MGGITDSRWASRSIADAMRKRAVAIAAIAATARISTLTLGPSQRILMCTDSSAYQHTHTPANVAFAPRCRYRRAVATNCCAGGRERQSRNDSDYRGGFSLSSHDVVTHITKAFIKHCKRNRCIFVSRARTPPDDADGRGCCYLWSVNAHDTVVRSVRFIP